MDKLTLIGLSDRFSTTAVFIPQAFKPWKTKSAKDLSFGTYLIFCTGVVLWLIYGILVSDILNILTNIVTTVLTFSIFYFKLSLKD